MWRHVFNAPNAVARWKRAATFGYGLLRLAVSRDGASGAIGVLVAACLAAEIAVVRVCGTICRKTGEKFVMWLEKR